MSLIGQGTYGCVYSPSLTCKKKYVKKYYTNKISKATSSVNAINEIKKQEYIDNNIDPKFKYHISPPVNCVPDLSINSNVKQLKQCDALKKDDGKIIPKNQISLLIMNNGGIDLKKFAKYLAKTHSHPRDQPSDISNTLTESAYYKEFNEKNKPKIIINFWRKSINLINALVDFAKNKTIHHDLKPENILYDHTKARLNIIDYGLARKYEDYHPNIAHFSYPPETYVLNPSVYNIISNASNKEFKHILGIDPINENTLFMDSYKYFMLYITGYTDELKYGFYTEQDILNIFNTNLYKGKTLNEIKKQAMITHDMYGMGLALMYVFVRTFFYLKKTDGSLNENFIKKMYEVLFSMVHPDCFKRPSINNLIKKYEKTLLLLGQPRMSTANNRNRFTRRSKNN